jgi:hypothetical protein
MRALLVALVAALTFVWSGVADAAAALCNLAPATIVGTPGRDVLVGSSGRDVIVALVGMT